MKREKVKCEITVDMDSGSYEVQFANLSEPGEDIDYSKLLFFLQKISTDLIEKAELEENPDITKLIN